MQAYACTTVFASFVIMNIVLIGYGKMGQAIEVAAQKSGHQIVARITSKNVELLGRLSSLKADVAIEFTTPQAAKSNVEACLAAHLPVVSGTTGWNEGVAQIQANVAAHSCAFLHASNFSIGVNLFFELNKRLASIMATHPQYLPAIEETHHIHKKDAPSGTAITLAEQIMEYNGQIKSWSLDAAPNTAVVPITAHRIDEVPGTHTVLYNSTIDSIQITHTAHNREGFVQGAILAAAYLAGKSGVFSMKDVLGLH
jgi:4-hydroxy-tetrahydrodipicolinate reductase